MRRGTKGHLSQADGETKRATKHIIVDFSPWRVILSNFFGDYDNPQQGYILASRMGWDGRFHGSCLVVQKATAAGASPFDFTSSMMVGETIALNFKKNVLNESTNQSALGNVHHFLSFSHVYIQLIQLLLRLGRWKIARWAAYSPLWPRLGGRWTWANQVRFFRACYPPGADDFFWFTEPTKTKTLSDLIHQKSDLTKNNGMNMYVCNNMMIIVIYIYIHPQAAWFAVARHASLLCSGGMGGCFLGWGGAGGCNNVLTRAFFWL